MNPAPRPLSHLLSSVHPPPEHTLADSLQTARELISAGQGLLALPLAGAAAGAGAAIVASDRQNRRSAYGSAIATAFTGLAILVTVSRARRERRRALGELVSGITHTFDTLTTNIGHIETAVSTLNQGLADIRSQLQTVLQRTDSLEVELQTAHKQVDSIREEIVTIVTRDREDEKRRQAGVMPNSASYQRFRRLLTADEQHHLRTTWSSLLETPLVGRELDYLADRVTWAELQCSGRLATSTPSMVLRMVLARQMAAEAQANQPVRLMDVGVLFGHGLGLLYEACLAQHSDIKLYAVDPFQGHYDKNPLDVMTGVPVTEWVFKRNMAALGVPDSALHTFNMLSSEAAKRQEVQALTGRVDLIVIEGAHSYEGIKTDFELYFPLLRDGGMILIDDYGSEDWPEVGRYVDEHVMGVEEVEFIGSAFQTAVVRKKACINEGHPPFGGSGHVG